MRTFPASVFLVFSVFFWRAPAAALSPPEDLEAFGDDLDLDLDLDLDMEGSGSGGTTQDAVSDETADGLERKAVPDSMKKYRSSKTAPKDLELEPWDREPTILEESRGLMESKEVLTGVLAGSLSGLVVAVLLGGLLIYKWQKSDSSGGRLVQGHRRETYHAVPDLSGAFHGEQVVLV